jgi:hypothetical protein
LRAGEDVVGLGELAADAFGVDEELLEEGLIE